MASFFRILVFIAFFSSGNARAQPGESLTMHQSQAIHASFRNGLRRDFYSVTPAGQNTAFRDTSVRHQTLFGSATAWRTWSCESVEAQYPEASSNLSARMTFRAAGELDNFATESTQIFFSNGYGGDESIALHAWQYLPESAVLVNRTSENNYYLRYAPLHMGDERNRRTVPRLLVEVTAPVMTTIGELPSHIIDSHTDGRQAVRYYLQCFPR